MQWRVDQGRLEYLNFGLICKQADALVALEGADLGAKPDPLRAVLPGMTGMPFPSGPNRLWRNYKRVFGLAFLATEIDGNLRCTDVCRELAASGEMRVDPDAYFVHFTQRFYYPSPVFEGYTPEDHRVFPACAILKLLGAQLLSEQPSSISIEEIFTKIIAGGLTGKEPLGEFIGLKSRSAHPSESALRQVRELVCFISQFSFLKWQRPYLFLEPVGSLDQTLGLIETIATPVVREQSPDPAEEILSLASLVPGGGEPGMVVPIQWNAPEFGFSEGRPNRVSHLRYERSRKLRDFFFSRRVAYRCDMCALSTGERYPWANNFLELHHLLPLSSPLRIKNTRTALDDLVPLCPNCHRATHLYYSLWLKKTDMGDFASKEQAFGCYTEAKHRLVHSN